MSRGEITVVSGLPRSGTSMMMKMLEAGGMEILTDNIRKADDDNPKGYYEFERVKKLEKDASWVGDARGKVIKVIAELLKHLPGEYSYKIVFMRRKMEEILDSQKQMLISRGEPADGISDEDLKGLFLKHLEKIEGWLASQSNMDVIYIHYNELLKYPARYSERLNRFLGNTLNTAKMVGVVDNTLYRQRR